MNKLFDLGFYAMVVGGILVLTRPGSQGPKLLTSAGNAFAHVEQAATGQKLG